VTTPLDHDVRFLRLGRDHWPIVEAVFGANGACGGCWCMYWRVEDGGRDWARDKGAINRARLQALVEQGDSHAILALSKDEPVGWCAFGPREQFPRLLRSRKLMRPDPAPWAIVCLFVKRRHRRSGIAARLVAEAARAAFDSGATAIEGYPVIPKSTNMPAAFAWTGLPKMFEAAGFGRVAHDAGARAIYVKHRS
jgi:GNAT superfamily N-acetyltransferase